jgi:hypothetical protein
MANKEHLEILRRGVDTWNEWRRENPTVRPDLRDANLSGAKLLKINFNGSYLSRVDFASADLKWANLTYADLTEANLRGALLAFADLRGAILISADFESTSLRETIFADVNLKNAKHLELCRHWGPSIIDHRTIIKSGRLPLAFLKGCGLPDSLMEYFPSLLNEPIQSYSCFISYSSRDDEFAQRLHADLQNNNVRCWFAPEDLKIGDKIRSAIDESIRIYDKLLLILSEHSVRSTWVEHEVETALDKEVEQKRTVLFPVRLDDTVMNINGGWAAKIRKERHIGDFREWKNNDAYMKAFQRLLRDLKSV